MLVEGRTEKLAFPFVFRALGYDADQEAIAIVDCAGKGNIPLFAEVCNACQIPYVVVHDRDAARGQQPTEAERISNEAIVRAAGKRRTIALVPDFEGVAGLRARRGEAGRGVQALPGRQRRSPGPAQAGGRARRRERARARRERPAAPRARCRCRRSRGCGSP